MSRLKLIRYPNQILRNRNQNLPFPLSKEHKGLIDRMVFSCKKYKGVGLAAPQIGKNLNFAIVHLEHYGMPAFAIINPKIVSASKEVHAMEEGCLSLPNQFGEVLRPEKIRVKFQTPEGKQITTELAGLAAKVFQHEIDHLNGVLIADKWDPATVHAMDEKERKKLREERKKIFKTTPVSSSK